MHIRIEIILEKKCQIGLTDLANPEKREQIGFTNLTMSKNTTLGNVVVSCAPSTNAGTLVVAIPWFVKKLVGVFGCRVCQVNDDFAAKG